MKNKIFISLLIGAAFIGCGNNPEPQQPVKKVVEKVKKVIDPCELDYQKCSAECKISTATEPNWKKTACEAKCKTYFAGCKTKQKTIEGYEYTKQKSIEGYNYIKTKVSGE